MALPVNALFDTLLPCAWRGLEFPITEVSLDMSQDIARHKKTDRDGAHLEATGRNPLVFHVRAVFKNSLVHGPQEKWPRPLYPTHYQAMLNACADKTTGAFQHPYLGKIQCKFLTWHEMLTAKSRDGVEVDLSFEETTDTEGSDDSFLGKAKPIDKAFGYARDLDASYQNFKKADPEKKLTFEDAINAIRSGIDQFSLLNKQLGGMINRVLYRIDSITAAVERAGDVQDWPITNAANRLRATIYDLRKQTVASKRDVRDYFLFKDSTLAAVSRVLANSVSDLVKLNPALASRPVVPATTVVRYYNVA